MKLENYLLVLSTTSLEDQGRFQQCGKWSRLLQCTQYKKGINNDPNSYRPVSVTSCECNVIEFIVRDQIMLHLEENYMISGQQHGLRRGRSCYTQMLEVINDWSHSGDKGNLLNFIYLDNSKAFDSVLHHRLLEKYGKRIKS